MDNIAGIAKSQAAMKHAQFSSKTTADIFGNIV